MGRVVAAGYRLHNWAFHRKSNSLESSRYGSPVSLTIGVHSSIGLKGLLLFGSQSQQKRCLPKLASGEMIAACRLAGSGSGFDAASIKSRASKNVGSAR